LTLTAGLNGAAAGEAAALVPLSTTRRSPLRLLRLAWHVRHISLSPPSSLRKRLQRKSVVFGWAVGAPVLFPGEHFPCFFFSCLFCCNPNE